MTAVTKKETESFLLEVTSSPDKLKLFLSITPKTGPIVISRDELLKLLEEGISLENIDLGVIDATLEVIAKGEPAKERRIKKGRDAEPGTDGKLVVLVKKFTGKGEVLGEGKKASLHALHLFDNVTKGQVVARLYPPKDGKNGLDVFGDIIPSKPGKAVALSLGEGLSQNADQVSSDGYERIIAESDGYIFGDGVSLSLSEELVIRGDLDFHFGTIDFVGRVSVSENVQPGFGITAKKGIKVGGEVRESPLISPEGSIEVKGFYFGGRGGNVITGKGFTASVIQQARVEAARSIIIEKESVDCILRSQEGVVAERGRIVGGSVFVVKGILAREIGNAVFAPMTIALCNSIEVSTEFAKLVVQIEEHEKIEKLLDLHLGPLATNPSRVVFLKGEHREKIEKLLQKREQVHKSKVALIAKKKNILEEGKVEDKILVSYRETLYPGVVIRAGEDLFEVKEPLKGPGTVEYLPAEKTFKVVPFQTFEITKEESHDKGNKKKR